MSLKQLPPKSDQRYRVHRSEKLYVGELACGSEGCTWYFYESIERVVYTFENGIEKVLYKGQYYELLKPRDLRNIVKSQLRSEGAVHIGGKCISHSDKDVRYTAYPFINVSTTDDMKQHSKYLAKVGRIKQARNSAKLNTL
jgi:hypothetical protein